MPLYVKFWGVRGSLPTPGPRTHRFGGNTSCVEIRSDKAQIVCDGGTGLRDLGESLIERSAGKPITAYMFFSHPHWDHIQGFPFFSPAYLKTTTLHIYGPSRGEKSIHKLLSGQMQSDYFPVNFTELGAKIVAGEFKKDKVKVEDVEVTQFSQRHPGGSLGFCFEHGGKKVVYATDNELDELVAGKIEGGADGVRKLPAEAVEPIRGADLLIADAQFTDAEYLKKMGWGHPRASTVVDLAIQANVRQLALYHHDPMQADEDVDAKVEACSTRAARLGSKLIVFAAREGVELKI